MSPLSKKNIATIARVASLAWWIYVVVLLSLFFGGLLLNYIVKRINEARLENRLLRNKTSTNQSTQIQRPAVSEHRPIPSGNISDNLTKGISLIFNKKENLIEDKRRKDEPKSVGVNDYVVNIQSSENIASASSTHSAKYEDMNKSVFLGNIYKELYEKRAGIDKTKSLSNADRDSILSEIVDKMVWKLNESRSTPSIRKLIDMQNESDLKDWALDLLKKKDEVQKIEEPVTPTADLFKKRDDGQATPSTSACG